VFLIVALFFHSVNFAEALKQKQDSNLRADLVAVSAARIQAENLQFMAALNELMLRETQTLYAMIIVTIISFGATSKYLEYVINSINNLSDLEKKFTKLNALIMYWQLQRIARANGFEGAFMHPLWPELPVTERPMKMYRDAFRIFTENPFVGDTSPIAGLDDILKDMDNKEKTKKPSTDNKKKPKKKFSQIFKNKKELVAAAMTPGKKNKLLKKIFKQLQETVGGAHYLDERYIDDKITVFCFDKNKNIRVASARVSHNTLPRTAELIDHENNNYMNIMQTPNNHNGFLVELVAVPDYIEKIPNMKKALDKMFATLEKMPLGNKVTQEHLNWIQH